LDSLGEQTHKKQLEKLRTLYARRRELAAQLSDLQMSEEERARKLNFARYQLHELDEAALENVTEDEELAQQQNILANVTQLEKSINDACTSLSGDNAGDEQACAVDMVQNALGEVERAARLDASLENSCELVRAGLTNLEEATRNLRRY